jgi:nucleoside-diphosphate-sugar epimerase
MSKAFVTGGSGFIGGRLISSLVAEGIDVRGLARSPRAADAVAALGAVPVDGDLSNPEALRAGAEGCELAFHAAAKVEDWGPWEEFERANVAGTRNVVEACRDAGVRRFVHVSTEAVLIAGEPLIDVDETAPRRPDSKAPYSRSKAMAEAIVLSSGTDGFEPVALRPRFVWGKGDLTLLPSLVDLVRRGRFAWIGGGRHRTDTTHVDNVVHGLRLAAEKGRSGEAYFVTDAESVVFREFVSKMLRTQGADPPDRNLPTPIAAALASGGETAWRILPLRGAPPLTRFSFWVASQQCTIDIAKARSELGYEPIKPRKEGLDELREGSGPAGS